MHAFAVVHRTLLTLALTPLFFLSLCLAQLEASFGLLRFGFILISIFGAILASYLFSLWSHEVIIEAYMEFQVHNALHTHRERGAFFFIASHH